MPVNERFGREDRVRAGRDIRAAFRAGERRRGRLCEVIVRDAGIGRPRFGTVVPKYGRNIVERNLVKRRLREIGRREVLPGLRGAGRTLDVVVRVFPRAYDADFESLRADVLGAVERAAR